MNLSNTKTLAELQTELQDFLLDKKSQTDDLTLETPAFSRQDRLAIYHNAYRLRLIDALSTDFPALKYYVGEDWFEKLTTQFIQACPSNHPSLRWLGEKLPGYLRERSEWRDKNSLIELAEFEWAQITAFDAADTTPITIDDIRSLPPERWMTLQLEFHPSLQLLNFFSNAPEKWSFAIKNEMQAKNDTTIETKTNAEIQAWLIWREDLQVVYRPLEKPEAWALNAFLNSRNFSDVCEGLCEWLDEEKVPLQTAQYLQQWTQGGLIVKIC